MEVVVMAVEVMAVEAMAVEVMAAVVTVEEEVCLFFGVSLQVI